MKGKKFGFSKAKGLQIHYTRSKEDDGTIKDTSYSKIDPTKSHLNYNLCEGDLVELLEEKKKTAYIRSEKTDVAFIDIVVPYPKDCNVDSKTYFENVYDIFTHDRTLKHCIGAFVHRDESNDHMHYICMPVERCPEFQKSKDVKVFDEEKGREVTRRIKTKYKEKFNAKKLFDKNFFNNLHPYLQKKINERGIEGTVITPERVKFNKWKKERIEYYNGLIKQNPDNREKYINQFWEEYKRMNPKEYKKDRPKDQRINDFNEMVELYKQELAEENSAVLKQVEADYKEQLSIDIKDVIDGNEKALVEFQSEQDKILEVKKKEVIAKLQKELDEYTYDASKKTEVEKQKIYKELQNKAYTKIFQTDKNGNLIEMNGMWLFTDYGKSLNQKILCQTIEDVMELNDPVMIKKAIEDLDILRYVEKSGMRDNILNKSRDSKENTIYRNNQNRGDDAR